MKILKSKIFDICNAVLSFSQNTVGEFFRDSLFIKNIDNLIFLLIILSLVSTAFMPSGAVAFSALAVALSVCLKAFIVKGEKIELELSSLILIVFLMISCFSVFNSTLQGRSLIGFGKTLIYSSYFFALIQYLKTNRNKIIPLLFLVALLLSAESFVGVIQSRMKIGSLAGWQDMSYLNPEEVLSRVYGTLKPFNPNLFAGYLIAGISSFIGIFAISLRKKSFWISLFSLAGFVLSAVTIFLTGSRGAYIALFFFALGIFALTYYFAFIYFKNNRLKQLWKILSAFVIFGVVAVILATPSILKRISSIFLMRQDSSTSFRMNVYESSLKMFADNIWFGIGTGNKVFREIYGLYMYSGFDALSTYNIFLEIGVESGIFALLAYISFFFCLLKEGIQTLLTRGDYTLKVLVATCVLALIGVLVHGFVDTVYFRPPIQLVFWLMAAVLVVLTRKEKADLL